MLDLTIETAKGSKGRSFSATLLASMTSPRLWESGQSGNDERPVWAVFAGTDASLRSFMANLRMGKKAEVQSSRRSAERFEFLKSVRFKHLWSRQPEGTVVTVYHPDLFAMDPGMVDPKGVAFICAPTQAWVDEQGIDAAPIIEHMRLLGSKWTDQEILQVLPLAYLFCVYLDRRTRFPLISDGRFYVQLFIAALETEAASYPSRHFTVRDTEVVGIVERPVAFKASHDQVGEMLTRETTSYFAVVGH